MLDAKALSGASVLVTGATGFLGSHLLSALIAAGLRPYALARDPGTLPDDCKPVRGDLTDHDALRAIVQDVKPEIIFHLGARTEPARDPSLNAVMTQVNLGATLALAEAASETRCKRFITTGTAEEYGHQPAPFHEGLPAQPLSPYSASKAAGTVWLQMMHRSLGLPVVMLRPFLIYGPGQLPPKLVPSACGSALKGADFDMTSGTQMRELTYVDDVVAGLLMAAQSEAALGEIINLGSGTEHSLLEIVSRIYTLAGKGGQPRPGALPDRPNDMQRYCADTSKAQSLLGWRASTSLDDGLRATLDWMARR
ncbi:NAD-dependent epimerase/dehydratase family protein [Primorskyibacter sp. S187A]|uniref:NAD-dependent epimerase/dehydratase family protein n=1 Tax=Primorskyibacter sp. S187A TaxID=3415130 RepID=UPI003C7A3509